MAGLNWPRKEEEHVAMMQAWKNTRDAERFRIAHQTALRQIQRDRADTHIYTRTLHRLLQNVCYPAEFE